MMAGETPQNSSSPAQPSQASPLSAIDGATPPATSSDSSPGATVAWPAPPEPAKESVLERLGSPPFPRGKFPFLGILASIYEQIHDRMSAK